MHYVPTPNSELGGFSPAELKFGTTDYKRFNLPPPLPPGHSYGEYVTHLDNNLKTKFTGLTSTDSIKIENVSHHGRDFSVISVPYTLKMLIQELGCMNIQLRIITEDNIEQLENLASSFDTTGMNMGLKVNVAKKQRVVDKTENETNGTVDDWNVAIDDVVSNSVAEIPEPETIPEVKITPEPNIIPVIGETIYGWTIKEYRVL
jgi:hypothetical protein